LIEAVKSDRSADSGHANSLRVLCIGEALIDRIEHLDGSATDTVGGSPKNTAVALARLGVSTALLARIGDDEYGAMIRRELDESGVDPSYLVTTVEPTTIATASVDESGEATYTFRIDGHSDGTWSPRELPSSFGDATIVVLAGSLSLALDGLRNTYDRIFDDRMRRILVFDPNIRPLLIGEDPDTNALARLKLAEWVAKATVVKASTDDLLWSHPGRPPLDVAQAWVECGTPLVLITDGANGAFAVTGRHEARLPAPHLDAVDSIGAGDAFTAGVSRWLLSHDINDRTAVEGLNRTQLEGLLVAGIEVATITCTRRGADPPWLEELGLEPNNAIRG
jgi:fructokinase